jgi:hypothetical protein
MKVGVTVESKRHDEVEVCLLSIYVGARIMHHVRRIDLGILIRTLVARLPVDMNL